MNRMQKLATFIALSVFTFIKISIPVNAGYILAIDQQLETFFTVGFAVVLVIVIIAVILIIYSRVTLSKISKKKKRADDDYF